MRYFLLLLLPIFVWSTAFKVASYNVENLFDAYYNGSEYEEYIPGKHNWNRRMVEIKLNHTTQVICDLDADILGLQEVENKEIFNALKAKLKRVGCGYKYSAITSKKGASIQVALLSRFPIVKQRDIVVSYSPRVRNILEVELEVEKRKFTLFVNHWKSKAYKGYESKRIKYAKALQARIARLAPNKEYMIIGDFNSDYNAYLTLDDKNNDTEGKTGFSDVLKTKIEEYQIPHTKKGEHYTLWKELPIEKRWSHKFYGKKSSLDQIVLPKSMFDGSGVDYVNNSFSVYKAKYLFTKRGYINRWRYKNGKHMAKGYSDHLPIFAYFDVKPYIKDKKQKVKKDIWHKLIDYFYTINTLEREIILDNVVVIYKWGNNAIIKQTKEGRGIYLYGCASKLKEGYRYDILVDSIKDYYGLKEITSAYSIKKYGKVFLKRFYKKSFDNIKQNEVIYEIIGKYKNKKFYVGGKDIPIYFKKKKYIPENNTNLKIRYAHVGYYKQLQLVIHSKKDFEIVE